MSAIARAAVLGVLLLGCSGCGSIMTRMSPGPDPGHSFVGGGVFPGVRAAPKMIGDFWTDSGEDIAVLLCLDFPLTAGFDVLLLPADLIGTCCEPAH